jgi:predicted DNA-binding protein
LLSEEWPTRAIRNIKLAIDADLHDALKRRSQATGKPMTYLVRQAIEQFLAIDSAVRHLKDGQDANRLE